MLSRYFILFILTLPAYAQTEAPKPAYAPPVSVLPEGSILQMLVGLLLVLAAIAAVAWLLKRFALNPGTTTGTIKVIAGTAVGQRERVVLVEISGTWLVLGVAPGQVRTLHTMPKAHAEQTVNELSTPRKGFQEWLKQMMEKRDAG
jgi:flagellar protein FliO/FliZ